MNGTNDLRTRLIRLREKRISNLRERLDATASEVERLLVIEVRYRMLLESVAQDCTCNRFAEDCGCLFDLSERARRELDALDDAE